MNSTATASTVSMGDNIVITCSYANPAALDVTPAVSWLFKGSAISSPSVDTSGASQQPVSLQWGP